MTMSQSLTPERATVIACDLEAAGPSGAQLVAVVQLGDERYRYRIDSSRSWKAVEVSASAISPISIDRQRLIDFALWTYLREFTGEIDARLARGKQPNPSAP
jgi:hypothetical protein